MFWLTVKYKELIKQLLWGDVRKPKTIAFLGAIINPLEKIYDKTLYQQQHDGRTIYLEKVLNEFFEIVGYDNQNHEQTKLVYIEDVLTQPKLYLYQELEDEVSFLEDEPDNDLEDIFLDGENENDVAFSFIVFVPDTYPFSEPFLRELIDQYRYIGKKYTIQTYTV
jgi:hypothetical protein